MHMHLACAQGCACLRAPDLFQLKQRPSVRFQFSSKTRFINSDFFFGGGRKGKKRRSLRDFLSNSIVSWKMDVFFLKRRMRVLFSRGGKFRWKIHAVIFPLAGQSQRNVCRGQITMYFVYFTIIHPPSSKSLEDGFVDSFDTLFDWTAFLDRTNPSNVRVTDAPRCNLRV